MMANFFVAIIVACSFVFGFLFVKTRKKESTAADNSVKLNRFMKKYQDYVDKTQNKG